MTTMNLVGDGYPLPIDKKLLALFQREIDKAELPVGSAVYIHFCDKSGYTSTKGGFRPIEVFVGDDRKMRYISEFAYIGIEPMVELAKSADFDFSQGVYQDITGCYRLDSPDVLSFWRLWQANFIEYVKMGVYSIEVKVGP